VWDRSTIAPHCYCVIVDLQALLSCTKCELAQSRQRVVVGSGPSRPTLLVVGEAPGKTEDEGGEPFIGRSGQLLFKLIEEEIGITRQECFVTNIAKCRPPNNRPPTPKECAACRPWLLEQLDSLHPQAVLSVGNTATRQLFSVSKGINEIHGRRFDLNGVSGIATFHPAAGLRSPNIVIPMIREDLRILKTQLESA
jgi:uracil-DNA glycosylase